MSNKTFLRTKSGAVRYSDIEAVNYEFDWQILLVAIPSFMLGLFIYSSWEATLGILWMACVVVLVPFFRRVSVVANGKNYKVDSGAGIRSIYLKTLKDVEENQPVGG